MMGWNIFVFSSETAKWNSTKLDRKQGLICNVLYQVSVFRADRKNKMVALSSDWLRHFRLLLWNRWTENLNVLYQVSVFFRVDQTRKMAARPLICRYIFGVSSETTERNSMTLDRKQDLNVLYQSCVFRVDQKNKMAALSPDCLIHFRLLPWNRWTADLNFLYQVCVFGPIRKKMSTPASDWLTHFRLLI